MNKLVEEFVEEDEGEEYEEVQLVNEYMEGEDEDLVEEYVEDVDGRVDGV